MTESQLPTKINPLLHSIYILILEQDRFLALIDKRNTVSMAMRAYKVSQKIIHQPQQFVKI
jgi:hypothetical protein